MNNPETHLFILWEKSLYKKDEIISEIKEKFQPNDLPARLKKGKITYDEALDELSLTIARS